MTADGSSGYWFISGELPSDHIDLALASSARDAARHFALKWQMQGARLEQQDQSDEESDSTAAPPDWANVGANLARSAERLYAMVDDDTLWTNVAE